MRFFFSLALLFFCSLLTSASAARDYSFELHIVNENAANNVCTDAEFDDLSNRAIPTISSVLADPKYDLKPTKASDWVSNGSNPKPNNRKERELCISSCQDRYCKSRNGGTPYLCQIYCPGCSWLGRMLHSQRELSDIEVVEIKTNIDGAMRGLLNKFINTSPYSKDCTKALIGATIGSTLEIL